MPSGRPDRVRAKEVSMSLRSRFNLWVGSLLAIGLIVTGFVSYSVLHRNAREHMVQTASLLMAAAEATRAYTTSFIKPQLDQRLEIEFLPQTVPAFAATETIISLKKQFPEFAYKEATLNPTNPRDRTSDWEADVVNLFRNDSTRKDIVGERMQGPVKALYIAKPIRVTSKSCLGCHSTAATAPPTMLKVYGEMNGFGWKQDEIIGAQIVSVPMSTADKGADESLAIIMGIMALFSVLVLATGNVLIGRHARPHVG